jgi:RNA polymerase sigma-70 factor (ECF subfamily)
MRAWLYTVAERRLVDELRRRRRAVEIVAVLGPESVADDETPDEIEEAVERLPLSQRRIVVMRIVEGRSYREIARELGCNEAACKMRLSRALRRLREDLRAAS